ncbi:ankyrin repeat domain-containing protein [Parashewanella spongiae]|uniref:Ankyrin repeat domain-containing protein n=1 Tax=Parashewanella spongiae TaxID=342950 RepID=A0A3A6U4X1_9GAMM|nr:ankyrin repeat domain-containing protein [Parashewanella spongiae]MCL1076977.1 ankyrin repeat domain-containing protein [Parashewanella spongiae]RJY19082.1 ankyrin repeat domain-containing protein [Parashewanella spongiae]
MSSISFNCTNLFSTSPEYKELTTSDVLTRVVRKVASTTQAGSTESPSTGLTFIFKLRSQSSGISIVKVHYTAVPVRNEGISFAFKSIVKFHKSSFDTPYVELTGRDNEVKSLRKNTDLLLGRLNKSDDFLKAVARGEVSKVRKNIKDGVDLNCRQSLPNSCTAFEIAAAKDDLAMIELLIGSGAEVGESHVLSSRALRLAAKHGKLQLVRTLLVKGAKPSLASEDGKSALYLAIESGHSVVANELVLKGADYAEKDSKNHRVLHFAAKKGNVEVATCLLEKCPPELREVFLNLEDSSGNRPIDYAAISGSAKLVQKLSCVSTKHNHQNSEGDNLLHLAARNGHSGLCRALFDEGFSIATRNHAGKTALKLSMECGNVSCSAELQAIAAEQGLLHADDKYYVNGSTSSESNWKKKTDFDSGASKNSKEVKCASFDGRLVEDVDKDGAKIVKTVWEEFETITFAENRSVSSGAATEEPKVGKLEFKSPNFTRRKLQVI